MRRYRCATWPTVFVLATRLSVAQDSTLEHAKTEAAHLRQTSTASAENVVVAIQTAREHSAGLHKALRDWVESALPGSRRALDSGFASMRIRAIAELERAGLFAFDGSAYSPGFITRLEYTRPAEDPATLIAIIGVGLPCGEDDVAYVYDYSRGAPRRTLESRGIGDHDETISDVRVSKRDAAGSQLILTLRYGVQCGSTWNTLSYDLFRSSAEGSSAVSLLRGEHGIFFGTERPYEVRLHPGELLMEVRDRSIDARIHSRTHVLHFKARGAAAERIDPVALQPQDFVDEWLTRPWSEMESRSIESGREKLKQWHGFLATGFVAGEF